MSALNPYNEIEVISQVANGDERAFSVLVSQYWRTIFIQALNYAKSHQKAEEVTQDIFLDVWNQRTTLTTIENFQAWLYTVAKYKIYRALKERVRVLAEVDYNEEADTVVSAFAAEQQVESREAYQLLLEGIENLPDKRKEVFKLSRLEGLTNLQIAAQLQIHPDTVAQYLSKALVFLRTYLNERGVQSIITIIILGGAAAHS